jgi:CubicO group peptidase (beta-lactamase class C family)
LVLIVVAMVGGAQAAPPETSVSAAGQEVVDGRQAVGLVVGMIGPQGRAAYGFGATKRGGTRPDGCTEFEIGSITKVFTGILLAEAVERGTVRLDQPVRTLLPEGAKLPRGQDREITLLDLATHASGLPRLPPWKYLGESDPYAAFGGKQLLESLGEVELDSQPGEKSAYSNLGSGLLGYLLARESGLSYEQLVVRDICDPLGMKDTRMTLGADQTARLAAPYDPAGKAATSWTFDALAGAGALRSTVDDMLIFAAANLGLDDGALAKAPVLALALPLSHARQRDLNGDDAAIGLAWHRGVLPQSRQTYVWHNGGTGGYSSFLGLVPEKQIGVVVLSNAGRGAGPSAIDALGIRLLEEATATK